MEAFQYQPLDKGHFRLLTLQCSEGGGPINCTLQHQLFQNTPNYWALSYVWDQKPLDNSIHPSSSSNLIFINSKPFPVKWNLLSALQHMREYADSDRVLWIDAICINQTDNLEKAHQLAMMGDIYRYSERVHAWLGEGGQDSDRIMRKAISVGNAHLDMWSPLSLGSGPFSGFSFLNVESVDDLLARRQQISQSTVLDDTDIAAFHNLMQRPYWERLWILQEVTLGSKVVFQCGYITIPWEYFGWLCDTVDQRPVHILDNLINEEMPTGSLIPMIRKRVRPLQLLKSQWQNLVTAQELKLLGLVHNFRDWGCAKDVDHVFALLSLVGYDDVELNEPNYESKVEEIFGRLVISYAKIYGRLDGLNCHTGDQNPNLRSWIPNFTSKNKSHSLLSTPAVSTEWLLGPKKLFAAAGVTIPEIEMIPSTNNLEIRGFRFDTVVKTGMVFPLHTIPFEDTQQLVEWTEASAQLFNSWRPGVYGCENYDDAVLRTYIADATLTGRTADGFEDMPEYKTSEGLRMINLSFIWKANKNRRPILTSKGYIGLGPCGTMEGDLVCVFWGGQTPFIVRSNSFQSSTESQESHFIGECYVHGIMDGEALEGMDVQSSSEMFVLL